MPGLPGVVIVFRPMIDGTELNSFARSFFEELSRAFPNLASRAVIDADPVAAPGSLLVTFAPDHSRPESVFQISADNEEVTVGFDLYHRHFDWPNEYANWETHPLLFIAALVQDRIVVEVWRKRGRWTKSLVRDANHEPDVANIGNHVVSIRSWSGRLDRDIER